MPSTPAKSVVENRPRGLLLVEEYGALGVAIKSALRKFAPLHTVKVASNFPTALELAGEIQPELVVLDLDPPQHGAIPFLLKLQADYPEARILVLAAGTSVALCAARGKRAAIHFIEKPFDLPEFGAAVQDLIGPWNGQSRSIPGTAGDLSLLDLAQLICVGSGSTALLAATCDGRIGEIHFRRGQIIHAETGEKKGIPGLAEIVSWTDVRLSEGELPEKLRRTIEGAWTDVLLPFARPRTGQETGQPRAGIKEPAPPPGGTGPKSGQKKILVIDDTDMLLIFVADVLSTFNPNLQITTAATGAEGYRLASELRPDLILLDYSLTDTTGDEVCRQLLTNEITARIPVLMMSGHFSELMRTAEAYPNVVDALPKPFLSGALISAVQRALANGPLPSGVSSPKESPAASSSGSGIAGPHLVPPGSEIPFAKSPPAESTPEPSAPGKKADPRHSPLANGHEPNSEPSSSSPPPASSAEGLTSAGIAPDPSFGGSTKKSGRKVTLARSSKQKAETAVVAPPPFIAPAPEQPPATPMPGGIPTSCAEPTELNVTFSLEIARVQLSPGLQVDSVRLRPASKLVAVEMQSAHELPHPGFGVGFELGPFQLNATGKIETLRLTPTRKSVQLSATTNSTPTGAFSPQAGESQLELVAAQNISMQVQLTAAFELVKVDLTPSLELKTIFVRARGDDVLLRNSSESGALRMELQEIEIDPAGELRTFLVRTIG